ncbi:MAG: type I-E CRISPR-associated protein Cas6/Cse3/CasE [Chloroflexota bacterium]
MTQFYLSQLRLNPTSRMVQKELGNPYEMHRTLQAAFNQSRQAANVLHRLEIDSYSDSISLLVQSTQLPDWENVTQKGQGRYLKSVPMSKEVNLSFSTGQLFRFRLVANPSVKRDGKRHAFYKEEDQLKWLLTKGVGSEALKRPSNGFKVIDAHIHKRGNQHGWIKSKANEDQPERNQRLKFQAVQYDGLLQVTDPNTFSAALINGIGPSKAFGCGLLSLAPA